MQFKKKLRRAAERHREDANTLFENNRWDNAGYHFGLSAECAFKAALEAAGFSTVDIKVDGREKDAYWEHFPALKRVSIAYTGRVSLNVTQTLTKSNFLQYWTVEMRYAQDTVDKAQCLKWKQDVEAFLNQCLAV